MGDLFLQSRHILGGLIFIHLYYFDFGIPANVKWFIS